MTRLDEIKARAEAGTSGLWVNPHGAMEKYGYEFINSPSGIVASKIDNHANAEFIAQSRTDVPALVAAVEVVLAMHKEVQWAESWPTCLHCNDAEGSPLAYPCPTVAAIRTALGEGEK